MNSDWYEPLDDSKDNKDAAQRFMDFQVMSTVSLVSSNPYHLTANPHQMISCQLGFWADPIYLTGDYPDSILKRYNDTILQRFTDEQKQQNKGSADFFGLNTYTTQLVTDGDKDGSGLKRRVQSQNSTSENKGIDWTGHTCPQWPQAGSEWLFSVPWGFRRLLKYIDNRYNSTAVPIFVTENGISSTGNGTDSKPELNDQWRIDHFTSYIGIFLFPDQALILPRPNETSNRGGQSKRRGLHRLVINGQFRMVRWL